MSNGVSMLNRKRGYAQDNKRKEVRDSLLKKSVIGNLVALVRSNGWRCDSVSAAMRDIPLFNPSKFGFKLSCNKNMYEYQIRNRGGTWVACIEKCDF